MSKRKKRKNLTLHSSVTFYFPTEERSDRTIREIEKRFLSGNDRGRVDFRVARTTRKENLADIQEYVVGQSLARERKKKNQSSNDIPRAENRTIVLLKRFDSR